MCIAALAPVAPFALGGLTGGLLFGGKKKSSNNSQPQAAQAPQQTQGTVGPPPAGY